MRPLSLIAAGALLSGCVTVTESNVTTLGIVDLCTARIVSQNLGQEDRAQLAMAEIKRRGGFSAAELRAIEAHTAFVGMSETAALCSWGNAFDAVNTTTTAGGVSKQYVYRSEYTKTRYLYSTNGRISGIQE